MADSDWTVNPGDPSQTDEEAARDADVDAQAGDDDASEASIEADIDAAVNDVLTGDAEGDAEAAAQARADAAEWDSIDDAADLIDGTETEVADITAAGGAGAGAGSGEAGTGDAGAGDAALQAELAERTEDLKRVSAEYANYRRRVERDRAGVISGAKADLAAALLPALDDLQLAESHGDLTGPLKAVSEKLNAALASAKVEAFGAEGEEFNPDLHEAVQDTSSGEDKVLGTVLRKGYRLGDRVLRTAMVIIADPS
ncbi:nucleotide exchange factor GrpE [Corynebacterium heidelbergense]|uniref:Protein GrpE n=1 Tax=Corynebacterium heidelbergense TaxID=2055947 RepID=A0A364V544_9CORY|nr:nucleotide exchange factor GrpE [Corynebacterium heidelbergense]RAV31747.1 nucleotide exchange factor GrpE [Corynebacterium heidelbergense]